MFSRSSLTSCSLTLILLVLGGRSEAASDFDTFLKPLFARSCTKCHGEKKVKGKVNLKELTTAKHLLAKPKLLKELIEVVDAYDMPPEDEPELDEQDRTKLVASLKAMLRESAAASTPEPVQIRRLNRFQYNNSIVDIFKLKRDVFPLSEKLMTRHGNYLAGSESKMPDRVEVSCLALKPEAGLREVQPFPKDLRAAHGFDNQANQLTLSPLLFDSFLRISVSILESPDFNEGTVGIWNEFFKEPPGGGDMKSEVRKRLDPFLMQVFRSAVDPATLDRYTSYALSKMETGLSFTESMKKTASAALSSPMFLYRYGSSPDNEDLFAIASNMSFFLWGSCPDLPLLRSAASGELAIREVFDRTIANMIADPKIERFLDTFPSQWMQLENILAATPDPKIARFFSIDKQHPAGLQMVLEPLLLFDAVFLEERPLVDLIAPSFSYQSEFLKTWYTSDLEPPRVEGSDIVEQNKARDELRKSLQEKIGTAQRELDALLGPVKSRLLAARKKNPRARRAIDLKPYAAWEFNGDLKDAIGSLDLEAHGKVDYKDGMVVLKNSYLQSRPLPIDLKAKTLEVWLKVHDVNRRGGGAMGIQGPGDFFDTIVLGERKDRHWISGSNGFSRTLDFPDSTEEKKPNEKLHLAMVYQEDGTTTLYRNGKPYGKPFRKGAATFPKNQSSVLFGLRHLPAGANRYLPVSLARARLYTRALNATEVAASSGSEQLYVSDKELTQALTPPQKEEQIALKKSLTQSEVALKKVPKNQDPGKAQQEAQKAFDNEIRNKLRSRTFQRGALADPRYGGVITNAAMLSMTSGPKRTHPIARGAWMIEVIFNDPPPPPPNDVPPLNEDSGNKNLTIREKFAKHREHPDCAGCHSRLDPLGFALENFDITGRWRDKYQNGRDVDASGVLMKKYPFNDITRFKESLVSENERFAKAFTAHLLRFALARELSPADTLTVDQIVADTAAEGFKIKSLIKGVILSESFLKVN